ncbi:MAG: thymidylate synthase [bacterium]
MSVDGPNREIPVLTARGRNLPEAWERSIVEVWEHGVPLPTEYDREGDPPSRDATMVLVVDRPFDEPRIHRAFPGGIADLEKYRLEVVEGVHDHWIRPEEGKWTYTYHKRLFDYVVREDPRLPEGEAPFAGVDQIAALVEKLAKVPHSRRAQAITWMPTLDPRTDDPPCLQRIWCRLTPEAEGWKLNMNTHWRSRDAYKAAFMNIYALTDLQRVLAGEIAARVGAPVAVGRYADLTDSYHLYGSYLAEIEERFLRSLRERSFADRTWRSDDPRIQAGLQWGREQIEQEKAGR